MRKQDHGWPPRDGILLHDAVGAAFGEAVRLAPAASREAAPQTATEGGSAIAKPSGGTAEPVAGSGSPGGGPADRGPQDAGLTPERAQEEGPRDQPGEAAGQGAVLRGTGRAAETPRPAAAEPGPLPGKPSAAAGDVNAGADAGAPGGAHTGAGQGAAPLGGYSGYNANNHTDKDADKDAYRGKQAPVAVRPSAAVARPAASTTEPSLARVLATTIRLWVTRRLRRLGIGRRRPPYAGAGTADRVPSRSRSAWGWRLAAMVLAVAILALVAVQLSGRLSKPGSRQEPAAHPGNSGASSLSAAALARDQAAAWIAQQVGSGTITACDPLVCSALLTHGIPAGGLLPLQSTGANPFGADVIVASPSVRSEYGSDLTSLYAPTLIASFGSGATRVDVRAIAPEGGAAYRAAEPSDLADRKEAGAQLLRNPRFHTTAQAARQITAAQVDARLLVTLASLVSQRTVTVGSFGDTGPGAPVEFRQVTITGPGGRGAALTADLDQVRTQRAPYLPDSATIVHPGGPNVLRIEFGAPTPQGLLSGGNSS